MTAPEPSVIETVKVALWVARAAWLWTAVQSFTPTHLRPHPSPLRHPLLLLLLVGLAPQRAQRTRSRLLRCRPWLALASAAVAVARADRFLRPCTGHALSRTARYHPRLAVAPVVWAAWEALALAFPPPSPSCLPAACTHLPLVLLLRRRRVELVVGPRACPCWIAHTACAPAMWPRLASTRAETCSRMMALAHRGRSCWERGQGPAAAVVAGVACILAVVVP